MSGFNLANDDRPARRAAARSDRSFASTISRASRSSVAHARVARRGPRRFGEYGSAQRLRALGTVLQINTYVTMRDTGRTWARRPVRAGATRKVLPGFEFSYIKPVNSRFGFSLSGGAPR